MQLDHRGNGIYCCFPAGGHLQGAESHHLNQRLLCRVRRLLYRRDGPLGWADSLALKAHAFLEQQREARVRGVLEASALSEDEFGAFLRRNGLHEAQLQEWRQKVQDALGKPKKAKRGKSPEAKRVKELERELHRKDKALAEVTALLVLKKKLDALLGAEGDDTTPRRER